MCFESSVCFGHISYWDQWNGKSVSSGKSTIKCFLMSLLSGTVWLREKKMFSSLDLCGQLWLWWLFIALSSAILCMLPSAGIFQWDFLPSSVQGWSLGSSPGQAALVRLPFPLLKENVSYLWGSSVSPSVLFLFLAVAVKVLGLAQQPPFIVWQQLMLPFQLLLPLLSLAAFLVSWLLLSLLELHRTRISQHWIYLMNLLRSCCWSLWLLEACRSPFYLCFLSLFSLSFPSWRSLQSSWVSPPSHSCFPGTVMSLGCAVWEGNPLPGMMFFSWDLPQF